MLPSSLLLSLLLSKGLKRKDGNTHRLSWCLLRYSHFRFRYIVNQLVVLAPTQEGIWATPVSVMADSLTSCDNGCYFDWIWDLVTYLVGLEE